MNNLLVVFDLDCINTKEVLKHASEFNFFNKKRKWLFFGGDVNTAKELLLAENLNIDSRILLVVNEDRFKHQIFYVKTPALQKNGLMFLNVVGNFTESKGLAFEDPFDMIDYSMYGTPLKIVICVRIDV